MGEIICSKTRGDEKRGERRGEEKPGGSDELSQLQHIQNQIYYPEYGHANEGGVTQGSQQLTVETLHSRGTTQQLPVALVWA